MNNMYQQAFEMLLKTKKFQINESDEATLVATRNLMADQRGIIGLILTIVSQKVLVLN